MARPPTIDRPCPLRWEALAPCADPTVRWCDRCRARVVDADRASPRRLGAWASLGAGRLCVAVGLAAASPAVAEPPEPAPRVVVVTMGGATHSTEKVGFAVRSTTPEEGSAALLDEVAAVLREHPEIRIEVAGHADRAERDPGPLSLRRAEAVRDLLVARGIDAARLVVAGDGADHPLVARDGDPGANRRVEFRLLED